MSLERRRQLVRIAAEREVLVLEDNPYGLLRYEGDALPPLYALDGGVYVMYLGTFSKILSPGIRLGWVCAPPPVLEKINVGKQGADLCTSTLSQLMVQAYFERGDWRDYVESLTEVYRPRRDAMLDALEEFFPPQAEWTRPEGGMFVWVTLPDFIDTTDLLARALRDNVAFVPGAGRLPGRPRARLDAAQLLRLRRGPHARGHPPDRQGHLRADGAVRHAHRRDDGDQHRGAGDRRARRTTRTPGRRSWSSAAAGRAGGREPGRRPQGRALARAPGVAALGRQRGGRARAGSATR